MNDDPVQPPHGHLERWSAAIGRLARPYVLIAAASSSAVATIALPFRSVSLFEAAAYITAAWAGVGLVYGAKAIEERGKAKSSAAVEIAKSGNNTEMP